jgi:hypothetical protein
MYALNIHRRRSATWTAAGGVLLSLGMAVPARADSDTGTVTANVEVESGITILDLDDSFTLRGLPGQLQETNTPPNSADISLTVVTNNPTGYNVVINPNPPVLPETEPALHGPGGAFIPFRLLEVAPVTAGVAGPYQAVLPNTVVHTQATPAGVAGDILKNRYRMRIPNVAQGLYTGTITYTVSTL